MWRGKSFWEEESKVHPKELFYFRFSAGTCLPRSVKLLRELESSPSDRNNGGYGNEEGLL